MQISNTMLAVCAAAVVSVAPSSFAADTPAQAKAREVLEQQLKQFSDASPSVQAVESDATAKAREALRRRVEETHSVSGFAPIEVPVTLPPSDSDAIAKAREVLRQKIDQTPQPAPAMAHRAAEGKIATYQPLPRPESPLSGDKQQRLRELLNQYRADQLSPEQYHQQRSKILAEP